jgi:hypothetical protein
LTVKKNKVHIARLIALVDLQNGPSTGLSGMKKLCRSKIGGSPMINGPGGNTIEYKSKVDITRHL